MSLIYKEQGIVKSLRDMTLQNWHHKDKEQQTFVQQC